MKYIHKWQAIVGEWVRDVFGSEVADNVQERSRRFFEEAIEVYQSYDGSREMAHKIVDIVFDKEKDKPEKETGQCLFTLLALGAASSVDVEVSLEECYRIAMTPERILKVKRNQAAKLAKGI